MNEIRFIPSGKLGLSLIFQFLIKNQTINTKSDEIFVPKFMGTWVYSSINNHILTSPVFSEQTKVLHMYHQFGIPQKIDEVVSFAKDNKLKIIEDCAHVLNCEKNNKNIIGDNGDFTIYSFSKFVNCYLLGGIKSKNEDFNKFVNDKINLSNKYQTYANYLIILLSKYLHSKKLMDINYSLYHHNSKPLNFLIKKYQKKIKSEKEIILDQYNYFKKNLYNHIPYDYLEFDNLICNLLPIEHNESITKQIEKKFMNYNFEIKKYFFDVNRNMIQPQYRQALSLNVGTSNKFFKEQVDIIKDIYEK